MASSCYPNSKTFASDTLSVVPKDFTPKTDHAVPTEMSMVWALHSAGLSAVKAERVAQIVRQVHFLERELGAKDPERNGAWFDGVHWTYQRYRDLHEYFPHWPSERMVRDVVTSAEDLGLLISRKWNYFKLYRLDYAGVRSLCHQTGVEPPAWAFDEPEAEGVQLDIFVEQEAAQAVAEPEESSQTPDVTPDYHDASLQTDMGRQPASLYTETTNKDKQSETLPPPGSSGGRLTDEFMSVVSEGLRRPRWELRNVERPLAAWAQSHGVGIHSTWAEELLNKVQDDQPISPIGYAVSIVRDWTHETWALDLGLPPERYEEPEPVPREYIYYEPDTSEPEDWPDGHPRQIWDAALGRMQDIVTRPNFETWLSKTVGIAYRDSEFIVGAPNAFIAEMLEERMYSLISRTLESVVMAEVEIRFEVVTSTGAPPELSAV